MTRRRPGLALLIVLGAGCSLDDARTPAGGRLRARVVRPVADTLRDTVRFDGAVEAAHCDTARGLVFDGVAGGNGVLLWVRPGDSALSGSYAYAARGDTTARRSAVAAVRFVASEISRGVTLDSGRLDVTEHGATLSVAVRGSGMGFPGGVRVAVEADFDSVPAPRDTVSCAAAP